MHIHLWGGHQQLRELGLGYCVFKEEALDFILMGVKGTKVWKWKRGIPGIRGVGTIYVKVLRKDIECCMQETAIGQWLERKVNEGE